MAHQHPTPTPSLHVVAPVIHEERRLQLEHFDSLDTKAGLVLAFSGAIAVLAKDVQSDLARSGVALIAIAGIVAVVSLVPRKQPYFRPLHVRNWIADPPDAVELRLLDTEVAMVTEAAGTIHLKSRVLAASLGLVVVGVILLGLGTLVFRDGAATRPAERHPSPVGVVQRPGTSTSTAPVRTRP